MYFINKELCKICVEDDYHSKTGKKIKTVAVLQNLKKDFLVCSGFTYEKEVNISDFSAFVKDNRKIAIGVKKNDYETFVVCVPYRNTISSIKVYGGECIYAQSTHIDDKKNFDGKAYHNFLYMLVNAKKEEKLMLTIKIDTVKVANQDYKTPDVDTITKLKHCDTIEITSFDDNHYTPDYSEDRYIEAFFSAKVLKSLKAKKCMEKVQNVIPVVV